MVAAAAALLGVALPWIDAPLLGRAGIATGDGKVLAVLALVALLAGVLVAGRRLGIAYLGCGGIGAVVAWSDLFDVAHRVRALGATRLAATVSTGAGLYLAVVATTAIAVCGMALTARKA